MERSFNNQGVNDMTTTTNPTAPAPTAKAQSETANKATSGKETSNLVTLDQLAREMKMPPRDARMLLRLAAKQTKLYPTLGKDHVARQPWQWAPGSKALEEARKALSATPTV
jgi:tagatose-1,6-bisphosphate aldolase non-catalytic subunit AgaZ/GatZ